MQFREAGLFGSKAKKKSNGAALALKEPMEWRNNFKKGARASPNFQAKEPFFKQ